MKRTIPPERLAAMATVAEATKSGRVLVACRSRAVRQQYMRAVLKAGGKLENLLFYTLSDKEAQDP
jgi:hypothetical protein